MLKGNGYKIINNEFVDFNNKDIIEIGPGVLPHEKFWLDKKPKSFDLIDSNFDFLKVCEKKLNIRNINSKKFLIKQASDINQIPSESYDYVLSFYSLEHVFDLEEYSVK